MMTDDDIQKSKRDLKKRMDSRRALSLRKIGERHPSMMKGDGSIPLKAENVER